MFKLGKIRRMVFWYIVIMTTTIYTFTSQLVRDPLLVKQGWSQKARSQEERFAEAGLMASSVLTTSLPPAEKCVLVGHGGTTANPLWTAWGRVRGT